MVSGKREIWIGSGATILATLGWFVIIPIGVDVPGSVKILALSPDFWPRIVVLMVAACGVVIFFQGFFAKGTVSPGGEASGDKTSSQPKNFYFDGRLQAVRVISAFAGLFIFYFLTPVLGVVVGCMVLVIAATHILGVESRAKAVSLAVLLPIFLYFFFIEVAHIPIPLGLFEDLR